MSSKRLLKKRIFNKQLETIHFALAVTVMKQTPPPPKKTETTHEYITERNRIYKISKKQI